MNKLTFLLLSLLALANLPQAKAQSQALPDTLAGIFIKERVIEKEQAVIYSNQQKGDAKRIIKIYSRGNKVLSSSVANSNNDNSKIGLIVPGQYRTGKHSEQGEVSAANDVDIKFTQGIRVSKCRLMVTDNLFKIYAYNFDSKEELQFVIEAIQRKITNHLKENE